MDFLRVHLGTGKIAREEVPEKYRLWGNRGLIAQLACDEIDPQCDALGPNNKLIIATSPLDGLGITSAGRIAVGGKSPLTGGIKEANAGGVAATKLVRQGIKAILVEGLPPAGELSILHIQGGTARLKPAGALTGLGTYAATEKLLQEYGRGAGVICIGQAGEYKLGSAGVFINDPQGDPSRACARGGIGALMGAKGLKAVVVADDGDRTPPVSDRERFLAARQALTKAILDEPAIGVYRDYGTMGMLMSLNAVSAMPTLNFRQGTWEKAEEISGDRLHDLILQRGGEGRNTHRCMPGCVIQCSNVVPDAQGKKVVAPLEYESAALLGANLGIADLDSLAVLNRMCNDYGVDTIEIGATLGVLAEAGLFAFGDARKAAELIGEIGKGTLLGRIIGSGAAVAGKVLGVLRVPVVKGQSMAGHEPRGIKSMSVTYALSPMGADHTAGATYRAPVDHHKPDGAMEVSRNAQVLTAFYDNFFCLFASRGVGKNTALCTELINAVYGTELGAEDIPRIGKEIIKRERAFNIAAGVVQEFVPEFMRYEKLEPQGLVSDIPRDEYRRFWDEDFWGEFPRV